MRSEHCEHTLYETLKTGEEKVSNQNKVTSVILGWIYTLLILRVNI
jgi:hypothetical protein